MKKICFETHPHLVLDHFSHCTARYSACSHCTSPYNYCAIVTSQPLSWLLLLPVLLTIFSAPIVPRLHHQQWLWAISLWILGFLHNYLLLATTSPNNSSRYHVCYVFCVLNPIVNLHSCTWTYPFQEFLDWSGVYRSVVLLVRK